MSSKDKKVGEVVRELREANLSPSAIGRLARALGITSRQLTEIGA